MKRVTKKRKQKNYFFPLIAVFTLSLCAVVTMLLVGGEETVEYFRQLNFEPDEKTVCIDAGHGGVQSGATGEQGKRLEKDDTLRLSLLVEKELAKRGYTVVMTRKDDSDISLSDRCKIANKARASLFVSIHRNSSSGDGNGVEMWVHSKSPTDDMLLAENLLSCMEKAGISKNRGIHRGYRDSANQNYYINRNTKMPSCLAEIGFITSSTDNKDFDTKLNQYAIALADGIEMTLKEMNGV